jgi:CHAD domain-containing protein
VRESGDLWKMRERSLDRARKSARRGDPEGLHDLRVALHRVSATARALGRRNVARRANKLVRSLSEQRQVQVDRQLLARLGKLGFLSPDAVTALAARWEKLAIRGERRVLRAADGRVVRRLLRRLDRLSRRDDETAVPRLERARRKAEAKLAQPIEGKDDYGLHRHRIAVKKARYLAEDLAALGLRRWTNQVEREKETQEALGRWNDLRLFRQRLAESRDEAEERGAVTLAAEIEQVLALLEPALAGIRRQAVDASRNTAGVVPIRRFAAH